jgi:hypothetical protein
MNYGAKVEVLGGTVAAVNGPHPQKAHSDEVEIMRADTWKESRNLASAKTTPDGRHIKAQNYGTSTMKWKGGRVWQILESFKRAKQRAIERYGAGEENRELVDDLISKTTHVLRARLVHLRSGRAGPELSLSTGECRSSRVGARYGSRPSANAIVTKSSMARWRRRMTKVIRCRARWNLSVKVASIAAVDIERARR